MDRFKRAVVPVLVFAVLIIALISRLSSCTTTAGGGAGNIDTPASPSGAVTPGTASPSPSVATAKPHGNADYTDEDIRSLFEEEGYAVKEIRTDQDATIVQFYKPAQSAVTATWFAWFDRETGSFDIVSDPLLADKFEITAEKTLTVLTTGVNYVNGKQMFPEIFNSIYDTYNKSAEYTGKTTPYFMPLEKSFTVSDDRFESIRSVVFDFDAVSIGFVPQTGHEAEFEIAYRYMPKTGVVCSNGYCYVTFYNTTLSDGFKAPKAGEGDGLRSFVSIACAGTNTVLTLELGDKAGRYNISAGYSPDDGMPYAVLKFRPNDTALSYPAGW